MPDPRPVLIVGAGLSGLACALHLHANGIPTRIIEASDDIGGRGRTDHFRGFLLDRGFQVYLTAYPEAGKILDLPALDLRSFEPGALVFDGKKLHRVMDVFRRPLSALQSALAPIGNLSDKLRVALLRHQLLKGPSGQPDQSTSAFLKKFGFSPRMIDVFFRSFYGGIFLENELRTSSRMFEFTFQMFSRGSAALPASGMSAIPRQIAARLPEGTIQLNSPVTQISQNTLTLTSGESLTGSHLVLATNAHQAAQLIPNFAPTAPNWRSVTNLYFSAPESPLKSAIIALNGTGKGLINNIAVLSDVAPSYAPKGQSLISISLLGLHQNDDLLTLVQQELTSWFGSKASRWEHLRTDRIPHALPSQPPGHPTPGFLRLDGTWICGDHTTTASIEGALIAGTKTAKAILASSPPDSA